jgi:hypothetical protein
MSYNAYTVSTTLRDENGALLPLYFKSFGDYKSPLFTYTLAAVFRVTGPHGEVARGLAAVAVLAGVLLLGLIAYRRTRSAVVAIAVLVLADLAPGLFEVGRAAYEVSLQPLLLCLLLLALDRASRTASASPAAAPSTSTTTNRPHSPTRGGTPPSTAFRSPVSCGCPTEEYPRSGRSLSCGSSAATSRAPSSHARATTGSPGRARCPAYGRCERG